MFTQPGGATFTAPAPAVPVAPVAPVFQHPPTPEQAAILTAAQTGQDLVIEAGAGTGKTSTLKMIAASTTQRGLYLAYNKAIAQDAAASFPAHVQCRTAHSLAFATVGRQFEHRLNGPRVPAREVARILQIPAVLDLGAHALTSVKVARLVMDALTRFCHSDWETPGDVHIPPVPGLEEPMAQMELRRRLVPMIHQAWHDITSVNGRLKFQHDHYLKIWALTHPTLPADLIFLDEAQDANPVIAQIVEAQAGQKILVGDQSQAIYGWRGAVDAMESFNGARLMLSQSFRFGQRIADEANEHLELLGAPLRLVGNPNRNSRIERIPAPRAVLCRTNAGAVGQVIAALAVGRKPALVGGGDDIRRLAEACQDLKSGRPTYHPELMAFNTWAEVQEYAEHDAGGQDLKTFVKLVDSHGPERILHVVDQLVDEYNADIIISTAHRAKGREWPTVRLAADFPEPYDKEGTLVPAEVMLAYVAVTRAQEGLDCSALTAGGLLPDPVPAAETLPFDVLVPHPEPIGTDLPESMVGWLNLAKEAKANKTRWADIEAQAVEKLKDFLGDREEATVHGRPAVTWKTSKPGTQLDGKRLAQDHPDIYQAYLVEKKAARPFKLVDES
ncbi:UvrD-helicase domain-containing protein [Streptosporangium sp. NPDC051022]|uniref:UvrD-helicase domain-containing protein n=1 Tax=Streptosporangium sp. NPDC051022 TaxID=3155752 RepID=UPI003421C9F0